MKDLIFSWGMLVLSVIFNAYGVMVIKWRLNELGAITLDSFRVGLNYFLMLLKSPWVVSGVFLFFIAPFLFAIALSRMDITVAYPAQVGLNFLIVILFGFIFLGEQLNFNKLLAIIFILLAVYVLYRGS